MNRDSTIVSVSLIATGVATCMLLGNPQMDNKNPIDWVGSPSQLSPFASVVRENNYVQLVKLESEMAILKEQVDTLEKRMADSHPKVTPPAGQEGGGINREVVFDSGHAKQREDDKLLIPLP